MQLESLRDEMRQCHEMRAEVFVRVRPRHRRSAENLLDYLTLRRHDLRPLQDTLAELGVSSLGHSEEHVMRSVEQVANVLRSMAGDRSLRCTAGTVDFDEGRRLLRRNAADLLGQEPIGRATRILVTLPTEAADDPSLATALLRAGMDCARIDCARDGPEEWRRMAANVRAATEELGGECPVLVDLPRPALRTGPVVDGPKVVRLRPRRDPRGVPVAAASAVLVPIGLEPTAGPRLATIPVPLGWVRGLSAGDHITLRDARNDARTLEVTEAGRWGARVSAWDTTYVETGTLLEGPHGRAVVGRLPAVEQSLRVHPGDLVTLTPDCSPATPQPRPSDQASPAQFRIGCTLPEALRAVRPGHRVWFDAGKIGGRVQSVRGEEVDVKVTVASAAGSKLRGDRGITLPDCELRLSPSGPDDAVLALAAELADVVGFPLARGVDDVADMQRRLAQAGRAEIGLVLEVEPTTGFDRLPESVLAAMASERIGVMVAPDDLADERDVERLEDAQEEVLWMCDAAHVPVIWAAQVPAHTARTGRPLRAEVFDAAMAGQAECVLIDEGPRSRQAVAALDDLLRRMEAHQHEKVLRFHRLRTWSFAARDHGMSGEAVP